MTPEGLFSIFTDWASGTSEATIGFCMERWILIVLGVLGFGAIVFGIVLASRIV